MASRRLSAVGLLAALGAVGCQQADPLPQVVLYVDVDMPIVSQLAQHQSPDAAIDTLRIDVLASDRSVLDARMLVIGSYADLPLSFGVARDAAVDGRVTVRIRAFRAAYANPGEQLGALLLDPLPETTVDRLVTVDVPDGGVEPRSVTLHGDCIGVRPRFGIGGQADRTCVDATSPDAAATEGIAPTALELSSAGTWELASVRPCTTAAPPGARCIPGGLSMLGDPTFLARNELEYDAVPVRVVYHSPFFLDETEVTVGQLRALVEKGYDGPLPDPPSGPSDENRAFCTWESTSHDDLPLNCLSYEAADAICEARGGTVPSEAQWEHAARGRGERLLYPWGNEIPECCTLSVARVAGGGCSVGGPEPVGTHRGGDGCPLGDVSRDGVVDLAGSVSELVTDSVAYFDDPCWQQVEATAILHDPVCQAATSRGARGAAFGMAFGDAPVPVRRAFIMSDDKYGVRCAYPGLP